MLRDDPRTRRYGMLFQHRRWVHPPLALAATLGAPAATGAIVCGAILVVGFLGIRLWAARHLGGAARVHRRKALKRRHLVTTGPFRYVRNPIYLANTIGLAGICLMLGPAWIAMLAGLVSIVWYGYVAHWEASLLARQYPSEYAAYGVRTPAFLPSLQPEPRRDQVPRYPWKKVLARERGAIVIVVLVVLATAVRSGSFLG